ncbi:MAG TPA: hypothetical protein VGO96_17205 [Pyrinomonadaceae bacterium]|jgi:hypothetical protein|nr:hypothetical protein [Pyrinomonadaceae bacterium]
MAAPKNYGRSLAYLQFQARLTSEIRNFWYLNNSTHYAKRWIESIPSEDIPATLGKFKGDEDHPFTSLDIPPNVFMDTQSDVLSSLRENTVVTFVTALEVYLFNAVERTIFLHPACMKDSGLTFTASELAGFMDKDEPKVAFASAVADKYMRNKSHAEMIKKLAKMIQSGVATSLKSDVEEWNKWSLVRNSIVHVGRGVSQDLYEVWKTRFTSVESPLNIKDREVVRVHHLALKIAKELDSRFIETTVKSSDAELFARELFVLYGISNPSQLSSQVSRILKCKFSKSNAERALALQRQGEKIIGFRFTPEMFKGVT